MRRGDLVTVELQGDQGKKRPALVVQADALDELGGVTLLPITGAREERLMVRVRVEPDAGNGLAKTSDIMVDKAQTAPRARLGAVIGRLDDPSMVTVNRMLAVFLGLA